MAPLTLEIYGSIIYPKSSAPEASDSVSIDIDGPPSSASASNDDDDDGGAADAYADLKTGPDHPLYRLPQLLSSSGMKVHLNAYVPSRRISLKTAHDAIHRHSRTSSIDKEHILYEVRKALVGQEYTIVSFGYGRHGGSADAFGQGLMRFTPGWFSGGSWSVEYKYKHPRMPREDRVELRIDDGGEEHGVWKMTYPAEAVVAREPPDGPDVFAENHKTLEIEMQARPQGEGWDAEAWRDFVAACWITKVWSDCTRDRGKSWLGKSVRSEDSSAAGLGRY